MGGWNWEALNEPWLLTCSVLFSYYFRLVASIERFFLDAILQFFRTPPKYYAETVLYEVPMGLGKTRVTNKTEESGHLQILQLFEKGCNRGCYLWNRISILHKNHPFPQTESIDGRTIIAFITSRRYSKVHLQNKQRPHWRYWSRSEYSHTDLFRGIGSNGCLNI